MEEAVTSYYSDAYGLDDDTDDPDCQTCGGDGWDEWTVLGCWKRGCTHGAHTCPNCGGAGRAEDQT